MARRREGRHGVRRPPVGLTHGCGAARDRCGTHGIARGAAAGDAGLADLVAGGHRARDLATLAAPRERVLHVERALRR